MMPNSSYIRFGSRNRRFQHHTRSDTKSIIDKNESTLVTINEERTSDKNDEETKKADSHKSEESSPAKNNQR
jgi:hypothetical protein